MGEIEVVVWKKIFDDPEYCEKQNEDGEFDQCDFLNRSGFCHLFSTARSFKALKYRSHVSSFKKCDACKKALANQKEAEEHSFCAACGG